MGATLKLNQGVATRTLESKQAVETRQLQTANNFVQLLPGVPAITDFTWAIANAGVGAEVAVLLNIGTMVTGLSQGADITTTAQEGATYANQVASFGYGNRQFAVRGFTYTVSDISQFQNAFLRYYSNAVGLQSSDSVGPYIRQMLPQIPANPNVLSLPIPLPDKIEPGIAYTISCVGAATQYITWNVIALAQLVMKVT